MKMVAIIVAVIVLFTIFIVVRASRTGEKSPTSGTPAPEFTLNSQDGKPLRLQDFRGKWVVLYFYPKDFTSGCTKEAHNFQRDLAQFEQKKTPSSSASASRMKPRTKSFAQKKGLASSSSRIPTTRFPQLTIRW